MSDNTQRICFGMGAAPATGELLRFADPVAGYAATGSFEGCAHTLTLAVYGYGAAPEAFVSWSAGLPVTPLYLKGRGVELWWTPTHAVLQCEPEDSATLTAAVAEFAWYEWTLRGLEAEVAAAWEALEQDKALAFDVTARDLPGSAALGARMGMAFQRRIRFARLEPHLFTPDSAAGPAAHKLGTELRERAGFEGRAEALDAHLEVAEHIYEMASQRMGEFRAAHGSNRVEWIIIWLLVAEVALSLLQVLLKR